MYDISIRELRHDDMESVRNIDELTQKVYHGDRGDRLYECDKEIYLKSRKNEFAINCATDLSFIALKDGNVVSFLFAHENLPFSEEIIVRHIAVHPSYQRCSIGEKLFDTLITKAKTKEKRTLGPRLIPITILQSSCTKNSGLKS